MATVKLSRDLLEAVIILAPEERLSPVEAMALLHRRGVVYGIQIEAVMALSTLVGPLEHRVAVGDPPVHGEDARLEYLFRTEDTQLAPVIDRYDHADYRNLGLIDNVQPGQVLARRVPPAPGQAGTSVNGLTLAARRVRDFPLTAGAGTVLNANGTVLYATQAGTPKLSGRTVAVHQRLRLPTSVSLATGNIAFDGDLEVMGDVEVLMEVNVTGHVVIHGSVNGGRVTAGGDVSVSGKVLQGSQVQCGGRLSVGFAEFVALECGGELRVRENLIHCQARAAGPITVGGCIVGGHVASGTAITAGAIGAPRGVPTVVMVDVAARQRETLFALGEECAAVQARLREISERLRAAQDGRAPLTSQALLDLIGTFHELTAEQAELEARAAEMQAPQSMTRCPIQARFGIHPEVDIRLGETHLRVTEPYLADSTWEGRPVEVLG